MSARKASAEVIAALLMMVITIVASVLLYVYSSGLIGALQTNIPQAPYLEHVSLDYYDWIGTTLKLTLRNVGVENVFLTDFFVGGIKVSGTFGTGCPNGSLSVQTACVVTLSGYGSVTNGVAYPVKIVTRNGAVFSYSCIAGHAV